MKHQLIAGTIATFDDGTLGANAGTFNATAAAYDVSATFTGVAGTSEFAGSGATFDITTDANGTVGIGYQTLASLTSGGGNTAVGYQAMTNAMDVGDFNTTSFNDSKCFG